MRGIQNEGVDGSAEHSHPGCEQARCEGIVPGDEDRHGVDELWAEGTTCQPPTYVVIELSFLFVGHVTRTW